jgi:pyruvate/2-oxoglutarate/acetoin dehydrogenase E1 component
MPTVLESLNQSLYSTLETDGRVYVIGEDLLDPYGGAFKVTSGLSTAYPDRTITTPVSEAGFLGVATGMALRGLRPVVEIMFGDFVTLIADQVINHLAKFRYMYNEQLSVPLVIRTPMGGRRGYGPTHSQTLEKLFLGIPGIRTLAPCALDDPGKLLSQAILKDDDPVLFIENKLLYTQPILGEGNVDEFKIKKVDPTQLANNDLRTRNYAPAYRLTLQEAPKPTLTIAAYGYMIDLCRQAAIQLAYEDEIFAEIIVLTQLSPFAIGPILNSVRSTRRLLVVEEGTYTLGWGAEVLARTAENLNGNLYNVGRVASLDLPIPASIGLERNVLPGVEDIIHSIKKWYK